MNEISPPFRRSPPSAPGSRLGCSPAWQTYFGKIFIIQIEVNFFAIFKYFKNLFNIAHLRDGMISISTLKMIGIIFQPQKNVHHKSIWLYHALPYQDRKLLHTWPGTQWCHSSRAQHRRGRGLRWPNIQPPSRQPTPARSSCICVGTDHTWMGKNDNRLFFRLSSDFGKLTYGCLSLCQCP